MRRQLLLMLLQQFLGRIGRIEGAVAGRGFGGARVIAADDEVGAAVAPAHYRVPERFPRACRSRCERQQREGGQAVRIVRQDGLVALHARKVAEILRPGDPDHRVDEDVSLRRFRRLHRELVRESVHGAAGVECDYPSPAEPGEERAQLLRGVPQLFVVIVGGKLDSFHRTTDIVGPHLLVQVANPRVPPAAGAVHALRLAVLVDLPAGAHFEDRQHEAFAVPQGDPGAGFQVPGRPLAHVQRHRHRPQRRIGEAQVLQHRFVGGFVHEARQGSEAAVEQQLEVAELPLAEGDRGQIQGLRLERFPPRFADEQRRRAPGKLRQGATHVLRSAGDLMGARL